MRSRTNVDRSRLHLPFDAESATTARQLLADLLVARGVHRAVLDDAMLVVHELVMNGIDHGRPDPQDGLVVFWSVEGDLLRIGVHDAGTDGVVAAQPPNVESPRGRGLAIIEAVSEAWRVTRNGGTEVSAWVRLLT